MQDRLQMLNQFITLAQKKAEPTFHPSNNMLLHNNHRKKRKRPKFEVYIDEEQLPETFIKNKKKVLKILRFSEHEFKRYWRSIYLSVKKVLVRQYNKTIPKDELLQKIINKPIIIKLSNDKARLFKHWFLGSKGQENRQFVKKVLNDWVLWSYKHPEHISQYPLVFAETSKVPKKKQKFAILESNYNNLNPAIQSNTLSHSLPNAFSINKNNADFIKTHSVSSSHQKPLEQSISAADEMKKEVYDKNIFDEILADPIILLEENPMIEQPPLAFYPELETEVTSQLKDNRYFGNLFNKSNRDPEKKLENIQKIGFNKTK